MTKQGLIEARYPLKHLWRDMALSVVGVLFVAGVLLTTTSNFTIKIFVLVFFGAACWFALRTLRLARTRVRIAPDRLIWTCFSKTKTLAWADLSRVRLRFYGSVRQKSNGDGWYQLNLTFTNGTKFYADQRLDEFQSLIDTLQKHTDKAEVDSTSQSYLSLFKAR